MEKVAVSKGLLVGMVGVAAASLLAVAFLLGRASGSALRVEGPRPSPAGREVASPVPEPPPAVPSAPSPASESSTLAEPLPAAAPSAPFPPPLVAPREPSRPVGAPGVAESPAVPRAAAPPAAGPDPERAAIAAYLAAIDSIQPAGLEGGAEGAANELATALANGDASGLEKLIRETEEAKRRLAAISPPASCAAHYRESASSLDDALGMLRAMKDAAASPDPAARLAEVASRATALRARAEALQREEQALRGRRAESAHGPSAEVDR